VPAVRHSTYRPVQISGAAPSPLTIGPSLSIISPGGCGPDHRFFSRSLGCQKPSGDLEDPKVMDAGIGFVSQIGPNVFPVSSWPPKGAWSPVAAKTLPTFPACREILRECRELHPRMGENMSSYKDLQIVLPLQAGRLAGNQVGNR
jgi:hypothetical protein